MGNYIGVGLLLLVFGFIVFLIAYLCYKITETPRQPPFACPATDYEERCDISPEKADVDRWGAREWGKYEVTTQCERCGETLHRFGVKKHKLTDANIPEEKIPS